MKDFFANPKVQAVILYSIGMVMLIALLSYSSSDPSFDLVTQKAPQNLLGYFGSYLADFCYQLFGIGVFIIPLCYISWGTILYKRLELAWASFKIVMMILALFGFAIAITPLQIKELPAGSGGAFGNIMYHALHQIEPLAILGLLILTPFFIFLALGISFQVYANVANKVQGTLDKTYPLLGTIKLPTTPKISFSWFSKKPEQTSNNTKFASIKKAPVVAYAEDYQNSKYPSDSNSYPEEDKSESYDREYQPSTQQVARNHVAASKQALNIGLLPPIELLRPAGNQQIKAETTQELKQNAEKLLSVLADFGVKGQIIDVSQGPVVTLYEFEPSAGTKSSRVIGLSDDVARSLSAVSTRISVIPGRNVLGIELPNKQRAFFCLRELIETPEYQNQDMSLPLILGKDLSGKPYIADLAKMPHLLVAGTTGSGKSVAINTMIMSLLYRYSPSECRLIMIDPKMLELSIYDNIPHLLTPVVTEPGKAIVALKWAVKEMENRYRLMSNLGVRNIANYNMKILEAASTGKVLERTVQTGFDPETGKPIYESIPISMEKLPFIVVIVDEMADLMLVAGKDIETSIQRLAQMARAAGIHIIMATQRPSVDVITGVIKANFPSRVSFKVTSKIDSRTILGEQGAEQLLGMGDMLYMGNSSKISRVHGPFVDDKEVEQVTNYLRDNGMPDYISAVTEQPDEEDLDINVADGGSDEASIYKKAVQIVKTERKVSTSYIQRCLRIGYNKAADIVDRMEREGIISPPNHSGKREILLPEE